MKRYFISHYNEFTSTYVYVNHVRVGANESNKERNSVPIVALACGNQTSFMYLAEKCFFNNHRIYILVDRQTDRQTCCVKTSRGLK